MRSVSAPINFYTVDSFAFADVSANGTEEFIFYERTQDYPRNTLLKLAHLKDGKLQITWSAPKELRADGGERFLVGNVDDDPESELVVFTGWRLVRDGIFGTRVFNWRGDELTTFGTDQLPAKAGALFDINNDGVMEVVLAVVPERFSNWEGREPAILMVCRFTSQGFETIHELKLPHAVRSLNAADLDGDGIDEFFTEEFSHDGTVNGQIAIYTVDAHVGIRRMFASNELVHRVQFFRAFQSQESTYLLIVQFGVNRPLAIYEPRLLSDGRYELVPQRALDPRLVQDAILSTMVYSEQSGHYVRLLDCTDEEKAKAGLRRCDKLEWITAEVFQ